MKSRKGTLVSDFALGEMLDVVLDGDPYPTYVSSSRVDLLPGERDDTNKLIRHTAGRNNQPTRLTGSKQKREVKIMTTTTKPSPRDLRRQAKALKIKGWQDMDVDKLEKAVRKAGGVITTQSTEKVNGKSAKSNGKAEKTSSKEKSSKKAKKAKASDEGEREPAENGNPYKEGTNLWYITEELIKGGQRSKMVARLKKKIELRPRVERDDWDEDAELDRRLLIIGQLLERDHNFTKEMEGRGADASIKLNPPD